MRDIGLLAVLSAFGWCESLGEGCIPLFAPAPEISDSDTTSAPGITSDTTEAPGVPTSGDTAAPATSTGTTTGAATTSTTTGDIGTSTTSTTSTDSCTDGVFQPDAEACEPDVTDSGQEPGLVTCDANCQPVYAVDLAAGHAHFCVLLTSGKVRCVGDKSQGQLGADPGNDVLGPDNNTAIEATAGIIDHAHDIDYDKNTNGRLFAGGMTTCVVVDAPRKSICWGGQVADSGKSSATDRAYSAIAISNHTAAKIGFRCGLEPNNAKYDLYCWGDLNDPQYSFFSDGGACGDSVAELDADPRTSFAVPPPPYPLTLDAGRLHMCAVGDVNGMTCAGLDKGGTNNNDGSVCNNEGSCVGGVCPTDCDETQCTTKKATALSLRGDNTCLIDPSQENDVQCIGPDPFARSAEAMCGVPANPTMIAATDEFVCIVDTTLEPDLVCCSMFVGIDQGPVFADPDDPRNDPWAVAKIDATATSVLLLQTDGRVTEITRNDMNWDLALLFPN